MEMEPRDNFVGLMAHQLLFCDTIQNLWPYENVFTITSTSFIVDVCQRLRLRLPKRIKRLTLKESH